MKIKYDEKLRLNKANTVMLDRINAIIEDYKEQGYKLTLRQLFYRLVTRNVIANETKEYKKLGTLLVKGRMAGVVDWEAIEDRIRVPYSAYTYGGVKDAIEDAERTYRLERQNNQDVHIELWVEKDALSGVLKPLATKYGIHMMVNRGYSSASAMHDAYQRFETAWDEDKHVVILYLGDHDPSGLDMVRDIRERIEDFRGGGGFADFVVEHIAITKSQIEQYEPPTNPARITDPRADWYISQHGSVSWEVDALPPNVLTALITKEIEERIDMDLYNETLEREEKDKERLIVIAEGIDDE